MQRLRLIKRLLDEGHRPGRLMASSAEALATLVLPRAPATEPPPDADESLEESPPDTLTTMATTTAMMATTAAPLISQALRDIRFILRSGTGG